MRTTITLEDDVAKLLDAERKKSSLSFKEVVNSALRMGLSPADHSPKKPFRTQSMDLGQPLVDLQNTGEVLALLDEEEFRDSHRR